MATKEVKRLSDDETEREMTRAMQAAVDKYPTVEEAIVALLEDPRSHVRMAGVFWPEIPSDVLEVMAADPSTLVRMAVTEHVNTPTKTLSKLAQVDPDILVREQAALNLKKRMH